MSYGTRRVITRSVFLRLERHDDARPHPMRAGRRWRRRIPDGWLFGEYIHTRDAGPLKLRWLKVINESGAPL